jgi:hypothetical protein
VTIAAPAAASAPLPAVAGGGRQGGLLSKLLRSAAPIDRLAASAGAAAAGPSGALAGVPPPTSSGRPFAGDFAASISGPNEGPATAAAAPKVTTSASAAPSVKRSVWGARGATTAVGSSHRPLAADSSALRTTAPPPVVVAAVPLWRQRAEADLAARTVAVAVREPVGPTAPTAVTVAADMTATTKAPQAAKNAAAHPRDVLDDFLDDVEAEDAAAGWGAALVAPPVVTTSAAAVASPSTGPASASVAASQPSGAGVGPSRPFGARVAGAARANDDDDNADGGAAYDTLHVATRLGHEQHRAEVAAPLGAVGTGVVAPPAVTQSVPLVDPVTGKKLSAMQRALLLAKKGPSGP